ncbi:hypothetical protein D3C79_947170 [compost metagenome]
MPRCPVFERTLSRCGATPNAWANKFRAMKVAMNQFHPVGEPGLDTYLEKHYLDLEQTHNETAGKLFAKKAMLLLLYSEIRRQADQHTDLYNGTHVYAPNA